MISTPQAYEIVDGKRREPQEVSFLDLVLDTRVRVVRFLGSHGAKMPKKLCNLPPSRRLL